MARQGKIARLPVALRDELNKRLLNGEPASKILPWLNAHEETRRVLAESADQEINDANLSNWRSGGFMEWEKKKDRHFQRIEHTRELAAMSMKLAQAGGGNLTEGASAMVAGEILGVLEELEDLKEKFSANDDPAQLELKLKATSAAIESLSLAIARLRKGDQNKEALRQRDDQLRQKDEELKLAREKFQRDQAEAVLKSARDEVVQQIANAPMDHSTQLEAVGKHLFGDLWK